MSANGASTTRRDRRLAEPGGRDLPCLLGSARLTLEPLREPEVDRGRGEDGGEQVDDEASHRGRDRRGADLWGEMGRGSQIPTTYGRKFFAAESDLDAPRKGDPRRYRGFRSGVRSASRRPSSRSRAPIPASRTGARAARTRSVPGPGRWRTRGIRTGGQVVGDHAGPWLGDEESIPAPEPDGPVGFTSQGNPGAACFPGEPGGADVHRVAWSAGTVGGEDDR